MQALLWKIHNMFQLFFAKAWIKSEYSQEIVKLNQTFQHYIHTIFISPKRRKFIKSAFFPPSPLTVSLATEERLPRRENCAWTTESNAGARARAHRVGVFRWRVGGKFEFFCEFLGKSRPRRREDYWCCSLIKNSAKKIHPYPCPLLFI